MLRLENYRFAPRYVERQNARARACVRAQPRDVQAHGHACPALYLLVGRSYPRVLDLNNIVFDAFYVRLFTAYEPTCLSEII